MAVRWTKRALASLVPIAAHIEHDNLARATTFIKELRAKTEMLAEFPAMGRPGRVTGTRELAVHENYIVPYRVREQHAAKHWPAVFD